MRIIKLILVILMISISQVNADINKNQLTCSNKVNSISISDYDEKSIYGFKFISDKGDFIFKAMIDGKTYYYKVVSGKEMSINPDRYSNIFNLYNDFGVGRSVKYLTKDSNEKDIEKYKKNLRNKLPVNNNMFDIIGIYSLGEKIIYGLINNKEKIILIKICTDLTKIEKIKKDKASTINIVKKEPKEKDYEELYRDIINIIYKIIGVIIILFIILKLYMRNEYNKAKNNKD